MSTPPDGIDLARDAGAGLHADVIRALSAQLLIVFLKQLKAMGHSLEFPCAQVDDTGHDLLSFSIDPDTRVFRFKLIRKS